MVVRFDLVEGHEEAFDALVARTAAAVHEHEPDTLLYLTHTVQGEPSARVFYEMYRSEAAKAVHDEQPYIKEFMRERDQHLAGRRVEFLDPADPGLL